MQDRAEAAAHGRQDGAGPWAERIARLARRLVPLARGEPVIRAFRDRRHGPGDGRPHGSDGLLTGELPGSGLPPLLVRAHEVTHSVLPGGHGRRKPGRGDAFWQYRPCQPGESIREVDWRRSASTRQLVVRQREWAAPQMVWMFCDPSGSMNWPGPDDRPGSPEEAHSGTRAERAGVLLLALATLLARAEERFGFLDAPFPPGSSARLTRTLALWLQDRASAGPLPLPQHLDRIQPASHLVWVSDFLDRAEDVRPILTELASRRVQLVLLQVLDDSEVTFPFRGRLLFEGLEAEPPYRSGDAQALATDYQARLDAHCGELRAQAQQFGFPFLTHLLGDGAASGLRDLYQVLQ